MKTLLLLTLLASFAGGFFFGVFLTAGEVVFAMLFLVWSGLNLFVAFGLINLITKNHEKSNL